MSSVLRLSGNVFTYNHGPGKRPRSVYGQGCGSPSGYEWEGHTFVARYWQRMIHLILIEWTTQKKKPFHGWPRYPHCPSSTSTLFAKDCIIPAFMRVDTQCDLTQKAWTCILSYKRPAHLVGDTPWIVSHDLTKETWKKDLGEWQRRWFSAWRNPGFCGALKHTKFPRFDEKSRSHSKSQRSELGHCMRRNRWIDAIRKCHQERGSAQFDDMPVIHLSFNIGCFKERYQAITYHIQQFHNTDVVINNTVHKDLRAYCCNSDIFHAILLDHGISISKVPHS